VLCMSGHTDEALFRHGILEAGLSFIQKPMTPESLLTKVREVLGIP
jgi:two-component system cell cycle sensor histidine kinase/response regulator CckA